MTNKYETKYFVGVDASLRKLLIEMSIKDKRSIRREVEIAIIEKAERLGFKRKTNGEWSYE